MLLLVLGLLVVQASVTEPTIVSPNEWSRCDVFRATAPMVIDGAIANKEWGRAQAAAGFTDLFHPERPPKYPTTAKLLWDDRYLYVAFEAVDDDIWAAMTNRDDYIFCEEVVEIYLDPEGRGRHYWEIEVSPKNVVLDLMTPRGGWQVFVDKNQRYDVKDIVTAARIYGTLDDRKDKDVKWTVEMAIPWSDFAGRKVSVPPKPGDSWRVQFFRIERPADDPDPHCWSWSKSPGVFHEPRNFGVAVFKDK
jgi:hypothetical protein